MEHKLYSCAFVCLTDVHRQRRPDAGANLPVNTKQEGTP